MKNLTHTFAILAFTIIFIIAGCADQCKNVDCENGECVEGVCNCIDGYEGVDCSDAINIKFLGDYQMVTESCSVSGPGNVPYTVIIGIVQIEPSDRFSFFIKGLNEDIDQIAIANIGKNGVDFSFSRSVFGFFGIDMDGEGTIDNSNNTIQITYTLYDPDTGEVLDECTGTIMRE